MAGIASPLLISLILVWISCAVCQETALHASLLSGYNRDARPRHLASDVVDVELKYELIRISNLDEKMEQITVYGFIQAVWYDDFLRWSPASFNGMTDTVLRPTQVWLPDIGLENSASTFYQSTFTYDFRVRVQYDGKVTWNFGGLKTLTCALDMTYYPFDLQKCNVNVENWAYTGHEVDLKAAHNLIDVDKYQQNSIWTLQNTSASKRNEYFAVTGNKPFPEVSFTLFIKRKPRYYILNLVLPVYFLVVVSLGTFWLSVDSGEKVSLAITNLLAFSVFQLVMSGAIPENSDHTPVLAKFIMTMMGVSAASVMTSIWVLYLHHRSALPGRVPRWLRRLCFHGIARLVCMRQMVPTSDSVSPVTSPNAPDEITVENVEDKKVPGSKGELGEVVEFLREYRTALRQQEAESQNQADWRAVAAVIDRCLFWIATTVVVIATAVFMAIEDAEH